MQYFQSHLVDQEIVLLRQLLGKPVYTLLSPGIEVKYPVISSPHFSIAAQQTGKLAYLVIDNQWLETPEEYLDYYKIGVTASALPRDLSTSRIMGITALNWPVSSVTPSIFANVTRICLLEDSYEGENEATRYDRALVFYGANAPLFSLSAADSILDSLEFTEAAEQIDAFVRTCRCRLCLD